MKKTALFFALCFACVSLFACGSKNDSSSSSKAGASSAATEAEKTSEAETDAPEQATEAQAEPTEAATEEPAEIVTEAPEVTPEEQNEGGAEALTEEQTLNAVKNYCFAKDPGMKEASESAEHTSYWSVSTNDNNEIVVLYRSYTGAQTSYYVDPASGDAYVTEYVPGIIDEEQRTDESFNVKEYLD